MMVQIFRHVLPFCLVAFSAGGCASNYSPNTYASNAVQLANKVETGIVVGYREVAIATNGTIGAVTGGAAGGVLGAQYADSALVAVGASTVGLVVGNALDHAVGDTTGWEYIVRKVNGDMLSVTQREKKPLELGQKVLVILGPQARVIADYSQVPEPAPQPAAQSVAKAEDKPPSPPPSPVKVEVVLSLAPGVAAHLPPGQSIVGQAIVAQADDSSDAESSPFKLVSIEPAEISARESEDAPVEGTPGPTPAE